MAYLRVRLRLCRGKTGDLGTSEKECENKCSGKDHFEREGCGYHRVESDEDLGEWVRTLISELKL